MDMHLPGMSGVEVTRAIRSAADSLNVDTPVIALTASVGVEDIKDYLAAGIDAVQAKPLQPAALHQLLAALCQPSGSRVAEVLAQEQAEIDQQLLAIHRQVFGQARLRKLFEQFQEQAKVLLVQAEDALQLDDLYELGELAHKLSGSSSTLGLLALARLATALETSSLEGDGARCRALLEELKVKLPSDLSSAWQACEG
ncbi:Aerobic respiration control sensor protein ArcB [compost metagenome]